MNAKSLVKFVEKFGNVMIIALVVTGTAAFGVANHAQEEGEMLSKAFLIFLGAIITVQVIPALVLLGAMIKGIAGLGEKEDSVDDSDSK